MNDRKKTHIDSLKNNIIHNNKNKIFSYSIERKGSSFLKLFFSKVNLPKYSYVEFKYSENFTQREFFHNVNEPVITIPGDRVSIRVILTKALIWNSLFSLELKSIEYDDNSRDFVGQDERKPYMYYEGTEIAEHALASAAAKIGRYGSCVLLGNENHVLTNQHIVIKNPGLTYGEIWFNWFNQSSDPASPVNQPVRLKPGSLLKMGLDSAGSTDDDYALFTLDNFDYINSNVKVLFGGLALSKKNPYPGENIYIPQYGNGGLRPMYISDIKNGEYADILSIRNNGNRLTYNADTQAGSSGSPVISRESNQMVGLHWGGGPPNVAVSAQKLNDELDSIISDSNISVSGLGKVKSFNAETTPFDIHEYLVPIELANKAVIIPFDTVKVNSYDNYSLIEVQAIDLITDEIFPLTFKASLVSDGYQTNIYDKNMTGSVFLKMYDFDIDIYGLIKFWITFKVNDPVNNINNYVIRAVIDVYDVYDIPFDILSAKVLDFKISKDSNFEESSVSYTVEGDDEYGFVASYNGQGPVDVVWTEYGYSKVKALLKNQSGDEVLVNLRGVRKTACSTRTMNSAITCASENKYSQLVLSFHSEDNENLLLKDDDVYQGIIPLQAKRWKDGNSENILIKITLQDDT